MLARVEQERLESLKYERATIYIKCIDENGETKTENDSEVVCVRKIFSSQRSSCRRETIAATTTGSSLSLPPPLSLSLSLSLSLFSFRA